MTMDNWFNKLFIEEAKKALEHRKGGAGGSEGAPNTIILVDEDGVEVAATLTDEVIDLTATANDIRIGTTAVTDDGITEGTLVVKE